MATVNARRWLAGDVDGHALIQGAVPRPKQHHDGLPYTPSGSQDAAAPGDGALRADYWQTYSVADSTMFTSSSSCSISTVSMREK